MEQNLSRQKSPDFHRLKIIKKQKLTKNIFSLGLEIPVELQSVFQFQAGQYVSVKYRHSDGYVVNDYSITTAPYEEKIELAIKINDENSSTNSLFNEYQIGDELEVSKPKGRFTLVTKPHEFRTIVGFATGIGITPIFSHFKNILHTEPRTRLFLFYGNKSEENVAFKQELDALVSEFSDRLEVYYFYSTQKIGNGFFEGRLDEKKVELIINQVLHLDDTDEESTIWDAVDEVLICGVGEMIKSVANACYNNGIPKRNIHFELFEAYNEDIFPVEVNFPLVEHIEVEFRHNGTDYKTTLENNKNKLLQSLSIQGFSVPFSCKSGICGSCECRLEEGEVELLENEYLTEKEEEKGNILACMSYAKTNKVKLNFDDF
ncbi:MAG: iron-sulfur cluster-binding domain-containing protein [Bergeyella zoohelcum]|nr:iron-sulfur cluster-binding domain-containing protein [Bergeyella zoohelcum]